MWLTKRCSAGQHNGSTEQAEGRKKENWLLGKESVEVGAECMSFRAFFQQLLWGFIVLCPRNKWVCFSAPMQIVYLLSNQQAR